MVQNKNIKALIFLSYIESGQDVDMQDMVLLQPLNSESKHTGLFDTLSLITSSAMNALNEDKNFWMEMKNAAIYNQNFLQLKSAQLPSGHPMLFIRECYKDFANLAFDVNISNLRITGNPGIGKTLFSYYLLYQFAIYKETVIYHRFDED